MGQIMLYARQQHQYVSEEWVGGHFCKCFTSYSPFFCHPLLTTPVFKFQLHICRVSSPHTLGGVSRSTFVLCCIIILLESNTITVHSSSRWHCVLFILSCTNKKYRNITEEIFYSARTGRKPTIRIRRLIR